MVSADGDGVCKVWDMEAILDQEKNEEDLLLASFQVDNSGVDHSQYNNTVVSSILGFLRSENPRKTLPVFMLMLYVDISPGQE